MNYNKLRKKRPKGGTYREGWGMAVWEI